MTGDWRDYRPAIWLAMLAVGLALLLNSPLVGAPFLGGAIGVALRIRQRRARAARAALAKPQQRQRQRPRDRKRKRKRKR
jgi:hypothetical protein